MGMREQVGNLTLQRSRIDDLSQRRVRRQRQQIA